MNVIPTNITVLLRTRESAEASIREIIERQIAREKLIAARDLAVETVKGKHNPAIDALTEAIDQDFQLLEDWAETNRAEFGDAKSMLIGGNRIGWRTGNPKVEPRGKVTLKTIVARLVKAGGELKDRFIREKPELNKEAILAVNRKAEGRDPELEALSEAVRKAAQTEAQETLRKIGVAVTQTESFYLEPDRAGQPEVRMAGEAKEAA
jgi:phage host-nuclease inhibitor protein Gam